jgi:5'-3' exonuclease
MAYLIIDGDHISYRASSSCEPTKAKPYLEPEDAAIHRVDDLMNRILLELNSTEYELYISGENNFRKVIYPEYKQNRTKPPPTYLQQCREYMITKWGAVIVNDMEVDDMCGIRMHFFYG